MRAAPVVLIHGEESFLVDREIRALEDECAISGADDMNRQLVDAAETAPADVINSARTLPFLGTRRLIIVRAVHKWTVEQWEKVTAYADAPNPSTCLALTTEKVDKRRAWWKAIKKTARIVDCPKPADAELGRWVRTMGQEAGVEIDGRVAQSLTLRVGPDLQLLWREIKKLQAYAGEDGRVSARDVEELVGEYRGTTVFVLCDALGEQELARAMGALRKLLQLGEPPVKLVFMIARHFRILWRARELGEATGGNVAPGKAASTLGLPPFVAKKALDQARRWPTPRLEKTFRQLLHADLELKSGGKEEVLERLVIELCSKESRRAKQRG